MTHQSAPLRAPDAGDAAEQVARLREVLTLVEEIACRRSTSIAALDENARLSAAYEAALPIVQRRFDGLTAETAGWAAAGVEALLILRRRGRPVQAAANRLADELTAALERLSRILGVQI